MHFPSVIHIILDKQGEINTTFIIQTRTLKLKTAKGPGGGGIEWWDLVLVLDPRYLIHAFYLPPDSSCDCSLASISPRLPPPHLITFPPPPLLPAPSVTSQVIEAICSH